MNHRTHTYGLIALTVVGTGFFFSVTDGSTALLLWPLACLAMMGAMMWGMGGMGRRSPGPQDHTHDDGRTHAHQ